MGNARRQVSDLRRDTDFLNFCQKLLTKFQGVLPPPRGQGLTRILSFLLFLEDIDECDVRSDDCDVQANCSNTNGSFTCKCNLGYSGNGVTCSGNPPHSPPPFSSLPEVVMF